METSAIATSITTIRREFDTDGRVNWIILSYSLSFLGFAVTFAHVSDITGRNVAFVAASVIFFAFSLGCGFAQDLNQLIILRTFQGIGGSGKIASAITPLSQLGCSLFLRSFDAVDTYAA